MWYLYLDESGDLGFDFVNKKPSDYFTICIIATSSRESFIKIGKAVRKTIRNKCFINRKGFQPELKGKTTNIAVKKYFWKQLQNYKFGIYAITLNKRRVYERLTRQKERVYNFIARKVLDQIPFENASTRVQIVVDKCKAKPEVVDFNNYVFRQLQARINPQIPINIDHLSSKDAPQLQAADLFAWGIFRKYERRDTEWFDVFKEKVLFDEQYL